MVVIVVPELSLSTLLVDSALSEELVIIGKLCVLEASSLLAEFVVSTVFVTLKVSAPLVEPKSPALLV